MKTFDNEVISVILNVYDALNIDFHSTLEQRLKQVYALLFHHQLQNDLIIVITLLDGLHDI